MKPLGRSLLLIAGFGLLALLVFLPQPEGGGSSHLAPLPAPLESTAQPSVLPGPSPPGRAAGVPSAFSGGVSDTSFRVSGMVSDENGDQLVGARLTMTSPAGEARESWTDQDGRFTFESLPRGTWGLLCRMAGYRPLKQILSPEDNSASPEGLDLHLVLRLALPLRVKILTPEGTPLLAKLGEDLPTDPFRVVASFLPPGELLPHSAFEASARIGAGFWMPPGGRGRKFQKLASGYEGILFLEHPLPVQLSLLLYQGVLASQPVPPGTEEVVFTVDPQTVRAFFGSVRLRLLDGRTGEPPVQASIRLKSIDRLMGSLLPGSGGNAEFTDLLPGPYMFLVRVPGLESIYRPFTLHPGEDLDFGELVLQGEEILRICAVDSRGALVPEATLALEERIPMDSWSPFGPGTVRHADPQGCFQVSLGPRRFVLKLEAPGRAPAVFLFDGSSGIASSRTVVMKEGVSVALDPFLEPGEQRFLSIRTEAGLPVLSKVVEGTTPVWIRLLPGVYVCVGHDLAGHERTTVFRVTGTSMHVPLRE